MKVGVKSYDDPPFAAAPCQYVAIFCRGHADFANMDGVDTLVTE